MKKQTYYLVTCCNSDSSHHLAAVMNDGRCSWYCFKCEGTFTVPYPEENQPRNKIQENELRPCEATSTSSCFKCGKTFSLHRQDRLRAEIDQDKQAIKELVEALKYAFHKPMCSWQRDPKRECTCGLVELLSKYSPEEK